VFNKKTYRGEASLHQRPYGEGNVSLEFVLTEKQFAKIFAKPLSEEQFSFIIIELGMIEMEA